MHDKILGTALPSVAALAYLGDARHSLYVRDMLVSYENRPSITFNPKVTESLVQAKGYTKGALVNILEDLVLVERLVLNFLMKVKVN